MAVDFKKVVEAATVSLHCEAGNSQGVIVPGKFILTAAHCVPLNTEGDMATRLDGYTVTIRKGGEEFLGELLATEPVSDIAVIGPPDYERSSAQCERFTRFCEGTQAVQLHETTIKSGESLSVSILSHKGIWITGNAVYYCSNTGCPTVTINVESRIEGGTSGGPIVTDDGKLLAIVSYFDEPKSLPSAGASRIEISGSAPLVPLTLPAWVLRSIEAAARGDEA